MDLKIVTYPAPPIYPQQQLFTNKLTHYQCANLSNSWNTRGLQWVKPLRLSCE